jgi:signal transduction histidine kinase
MAEVVRSASTTFGRGFFGVVYQLRDGDPWQLCQFAPDGRPTRSQVIESPPARSDGSMKRASLGALCNTMQLSMSAMSLLPWLADYLLDAGDLRNVQLLSLTVSWSEGLAVSGPAVVLLHDRDVAAMMDRPMLQALTATWGSVIAAAAQQEAARRLGERLASSNRSLSETQKRLAETESLARLGEMAAGAAHEMNNPLTVISGRAQMLASTKLDATKKAAAEAIVSASQDLTDLITSLRLLSDPPAPSPRPTALIDLVTAAVVRAEQRTGSAGRVRVSTPPNGASSILDRDMVATALSELLINALQASEKTPVEVRVQSAGADGRLSVQVIDQGTGMSPRALQHAFDPFFSEKPAGGKPASASLAPAASSNCMAARSSFPARRATERRPPSASALRSRRQPPTSATPHKRETHHVPTQEHTAG